VSALFRTQRLPHRNKGFSLVEIMVGMVIGLLGIIVMLQMLSLSESQKRTTSGSDDAQNAGAITLYGLQRDIQQSGYGVSAQRLIGCSVLLRAGVTLNSLAPVVINPAFIPTAASDANSDTLLVVYGNSNSPGEGDGITSQTGQNIYTVQTQTSYNVGDNVIAQYAARQTTCALSLDSIQIVPASSVNVTVATGVATIMTTNTSAGITPVLYNLGITPSVLVYAVRNGNLAVCNFINDNCSSPANAEITTANESVWVPIAGNIVSLKAQYGRDTNTLPMNGIVDTYDQTTPTTACGWIRTGAVRLALVARGGGGANNTPVPTWAGSAADPINLGAFPTWQNYRYKVFETVVPIRNVTIQGVVPGC
jgi:type IV pilus assembly protein PilW